MNKLKIILIFTAIALFNKQTFCQKKTNLFMDMGLGFQFFNAKIQGSSYSSFVQTPNPKLFLALGLEHKINKRLKLGMNINFNLSKTETYFNYYDETSQAFYKEWNGHEDINYGYALGIRYTPRVMNDRFSIGTGLNFQKLSIQAIKTNKKFNVLLMHYNNSNDFSKDYNSLLYYVNIGFSFGRKRNSEALIEFTSTVNKPLYSYDDYFYNGKLIESSHYKANMMFVVLKLRQIIGFNRVQDHSVKKNNLFFEIGAGEQFSKKKIKGSKYNSFVLTPIPKLFLALGLAHKINKRMAICFNLNANQSKTETQFNYRNETDGGTYKENVWHRDNNLGLGLGLRYMPNFCNDKLSINSGLNFQKMSSMIFSSPGSYNSLDSTRFSSTFNNWTEKYNSLVYYINLGYSLGKKKKSEILLEYNTTLNKPVYGTTDFYYKGQLVESSSYKVNMRFAVFKIRRWF